MIVKFRNNQYPPMKPEDVSLSEWSKLMINSVTQEGELEDVGELAGKRLVNAYAGNIDAARTAVDVLAVEAQAADKFEGDFKVNADFFIHGMRSAIFAAEAA